MRALIVMCLLLAGCVPRDAEEDRLRQVVCTHNGSEVYRSEPSDAWGVGRSTDYGGLIRIGAGYYLPNPGDECKILEVTK